MTQEKFTPGPWTLYDDPESPIVLGRIDDENYDLAIIPDDQLPEEMRKANANLIASAPDMYEALLVCWKSLQTYGEHPLIKLQVEAALNKANGTITK